MTPFARPTSARKPGLHPQARCRAGCLQIGRVNHDGLRIDAYGRQPFHHVEESAHLALALPAIVERPVRPILLRRIPPSRPVKNDENDAAQHRPSINARVAATFGKVRLQMRLLLVRQPVHVVDSQSPFGA
jgi:hypothetical protein